MAKRSLMATPEEKQALYERWQASKRAARRESKQPPRMTEAQRMAEAEARWGHTLEWERRRIQAWRWYHKDLPGDVHLMPPYREDFSRRPIMWRGEPDYSEMVVEEDLIDGMRWRPKNRACPLTYTYPYTALKACGSCNRRVRPCGGLRGLTYSRVEINPTRRSYNFEHEDAAMVCIRCFNTRRHHNQEVRRIWEIQSLLTEVRREIRNGRN